MMRIEDVVIKTIVSVEVPVATACKMFMPFRGNCFGRFPYIYRVWTLFNLEMCRFFFSLLELKVLIICRLSSIRLSVNFHICVLFSALPISSAVFTSLSMSIPPHFQDQVIRHICKVHQHLNWKEKVEIDSETKRSHHKGYI